MTDGQVRYDPLLCDGENPTIDNPVSPDGRISPEDRHTIPARQGRAVHLNEGDRLFILNRRGHQVCDFFALAYRSPAEMLSMEHTRTALGRVYVRKGDTLVSNLRRPMIEIVEDTSPGIHDILIACCDHARYQQLGAEDYHDNCADNFRMALKAIGVQPTHVPSPFNIWMNIPVAEDGRYEWTEPVSKPGDHIALEAKQPCICVMSACPQDMTPVNGIDTEPAELIFWIESGGA
jgi:uncharacterized protein YcgI (DUF1989 family)